MSIRPNVLMGRGEMVETNSGSTIDNYVLRDPLLIYKARFFRVWMKILKKERGGFSSSSKEFYPNGKLMLSELLVPQMLFGSVIFCHWTT